MFQLARYIAVMTLGASSVFAATIPDDLDLSVVRAIPSQHDGRWPPLDTVARDVVESVTGDSFFEGHDPVAVLLAWTFQPEVWSREPLIRLANSELRRELQLPQDRTAFSYADLINHRPLRLLIEQLSQMEEGKKPDPLQSKVGKINGKLATLQRIFAGRVIKMIPNATDPIGMWKTFPMSDRHDAGEHSAAAPAWFTMKRAFVANDPQAFAKASITLRDTLNKLPTAFRPDRALIDVELKYNRVHPFRIAWQVMLVGAILFALATMVRRRWFDAIAMVAMLAGFGLLTYGLSLRWTIAGRIPASNMFESLLFLSWGMGAFAIV